MPTIAIRTPADVGAAIRSLRRAAGLDQAELARRIGASRLWVNQIERGKPGAGLGLVMRAFAALDAELVIRDPGDNRAADDDLPTARIDINAIVDGLRGKRMP